jgi:hypothetical protein
MSTHRAGAPDLDLTDEVDPSSAATEEHSAMNFCPVGSAQADLAEQTERLALEILPAVRAS